MADIVALEIETNLCEYPYEKRFPSSLKLLDFKKKLELIVGAEAKSIGVKLLAADGKLAASLAGDDSTLKELGVRTGMRVFVEDLSGQNVSLNDDSMVEKYEMSEAAYSQRQDTVRAWKKALIAENQPPVGPTPEELYLKAADSINLDDRCEVTTKGNFGRRGCVVFKGTTQFKTGVWIGVQYDEPVGKNDGSVEGVRYFTCEPLHGGFVRPTDVRCGDFPEEGFDEI